jgi:hypothetical protein
LGIAYISSDEPHSLKHYLVKPTDTGFHSSFLSISKKFSSIFCCLLLLSNFLSASSKITFPDFLRDKPQFSRVILSLSLSLLSLSPTSPPSVSLCSAVHLFIGFDVDSIRCCSWSLTIRAVLNSDSRYLVAFCTSLLVNSNILG